MSRILRFIHILDGEFFILKLRGEIFKIIMNDFAISKTTLKIMFSFIPDVPMMSRRRTDIAKKMILYIFFDRKLCILSRI